MLDEVKSAAGRRTLALPAPVADLLKKHRSVQDSERFTAAHLWEGGDFVFTTPVGSPIDPRNDLRQWKALLASAGVREVRLHDARHTAATILLVLGVNQRAVMGIMGWSSPSMTLRYQHLTPDLQIGVADQVADLLWRPKTTGDSADGAPTGVGTPN